MAQQQAKWIWNGPAEALKNGEATEAQIGNRAGRLRDFTKQFVQTVQGFNDYTLKNKVLLTAMDEPQGLKTLNAGTPDGYPSFGAPGSNVWMLDEFAKRGATQEDWARMTGRAKSVVDSIKRNRPIYILEVPMRGRLTPAAFDGDGGSIHWLLNPHCVVRYTCRVTCP